MYRFPHCPYAGMCWTGGQLPIAGDSAFYIGWRTATFLLSPNQLESHGLTNIENGVGRGNAAGRLQGLKAHPRVLLQPMDERVAHGGCRRPNTTPTGELFPRQTNR